MNIWNCKRYFDEYERRKMKEISQELGLEYIGGNELWGGKRRTLYDSRYVYGKPADMPISEYIAKCHELRDKLYAANVRPIILKADGLNIWVVHRNLVLPCDENGILLDRTRELSDRKAWQYERDFPQNCILPQRTDS